MAAAIIRNRTFESISGTTVTIGLDVTVALPTSTGNFHTTASFGIDDLAPQKFNKIREAIVSEAQRFFGVGIDANRLFDLMGLTNL